MATETPDSLSESKQLRYAHLKGRVFEAVLLASTLVGVVSLALLFGYIFFDAFKPQTANASWYLLFFGTLVAPTAAFTLYIRRRPAMRRANAKAFAAVFGGLALALASFVTLDALNPYGVLVYVVTAGILPAAILGYSKVTQKTTIAGPAVVVAVVFGALWTVGSEVVVYPLLQLLFFLPEAVLGWIPLVGSIPIPVGIGSLVWVVTVGGPLAAVGVYAYETEDYRRSALAAPVVAALSYVGTTGIDSLLRPFIEILAMWLVYIGVVGLPIAAGVGIAMARRRTAKDGAIAVGAALAGTVVVGGICLAIGLDPSFWVVLFSGAVVPTGYVVATTVLDEREGSIGLAGPFVLVGGVLLGAILEDMLGVVGPDSWVTPTLLLNTWNGINPDKAGAYPDIVGSILIVTTMAILAFPVGIGAAIYLEEYAPDTGWKGRFANLLEINISNLAGVPSVVYGLLGLALFNNALNFPPGIVFSAAATLGLLILPIVIVSSQEAIRSVPDDLRRASYGMGASRWQTLRNVVLPEAVPGILTGTILALGRAIGETAPLIIIAVPTTRFSVPDGLLSSGAALPLKVFSASANAIPEYRKGVVAALAVVLLVLMLTMNAVAIVVRNKYQQDN